MLVIQSNRQIFFSAKNIKKHLNICHLCIKYQHSLIIFAYQGWIFCQDWHMHNFATIQGDFFPLKVPSTKKLILARLGVSRPIYVNVDSPNQGFPYFLGGYQWNKLAKLGDAISPNLKLSPTDPLTDWLTGVSCILVVFNLQERANI